MGIAASSNGTRHRELGRLKNNHKQIEICEKTVENKGGVRPKGGRKADVTARVLAGEIDGYFKQHRAPTPSSAQKISAALLLLDEVDSAVDGKDLETIHEKPQELSVLFS